MRHSKEEDDDDGIQFKVENQFKFEHPIRRTQPNAKKFRSNPPDGSPVEPN